MKRWTKEQFLNEADIMCGREKHLKMVDGYFKKHKTASILSVLNYPVAEAAKGWVIFSLDIELWYRAAPGKSLAGVVKYWDAFEAAIRKELKK